MPNQYTRGQWAEAVLADLGNTNPSDATVNFVINWTARENGYPQSGYNLLNMTNAVVDTTGVPYTDNASGWPVFASMDDAAKATALGMEKNDYPTLTYDLQHNAVSDSPGLEQDLSRWSGGGYNSIPTTTPTVSLLESGTVGADITNTQLAQGTPGNTIANLEQVLANIASAWQVLNDPHTWIVVGLFVAALAVTIIGVVVLEHTEQMQA